MPDLMWVSSALSGRFGAGVCLGTAPGALTARFKARWLRSNLDASLGRHPQGPLLAFAWAWRDAP
eukprot:6214784-Pleurochrysis_carterae.AAC.2